MPPPPRDPNQATYTGGTPTAGYAAPSYLARTPQGMKPQEDFSQSTWMQDWWETKGKANRARYLVRNPEQVPDVGRSRVGAGTSQWQQYQLRKAAELDAEFDRRNELVGINHPVVKELVEQARAAGVRLEPGDVANLARVGELERAKNIVMDRIKNGDNRGVGNVMMSMRQRDPKMAALLSPMVEEAVAAWVKEQAEDPNLVEKAIAWLGTSEYSPVAKGLQGLTWLNDQVRHVGAAATYSPNGGLESLGNSLMLNPGTIAGRAMQNWSATSRGAMSEQRLEELRKQYPPQVVDAAVEITMALADGDDSVFARMLSDDTTDPQVVNFIRDVLYNGPQTAGFDAGDLQEQIEGARLDNIGDIVSTGLAQVVKEQTGSDYMYSSSWRGAMSQVGNLAWELGADPLNYVGTPIRAVTAARYAIAKLAPTGLTGEAARIPIAKALASRTVAGMETNRARRYFQGILDQLDTIDEFAPGSIEASSAWQRLVRQHREIPEDILLDMAKPQNIQKVNGKRTMDGALIGEGEGAARRADGFIDYIVNQNERWQAAVGKASDKATKAGESFLIEQAVKAKLIDELEPDDLIALAAGKRPQNLTITTDEILAQARAKLPQETLDRADEIVDGAVRRYGADQPYLASRFKQYNKRDQVIPYTGVLGDVRRRAVNSIIAERIGATRTRAIVDEFIGEDLSPEATANALDTALAQDMAGTDRSVRGRPGKGQALADRISGMLSSMPNGRFINIKTGENSEEVYRYARMFYTRKTAEFLADKFRRGDEGTRRLILAGLIRSSAASKGVNLSAEDVWARIGDLATGSRRNEMFAIPVPGTPSGDMMKATLDQAVNAGREAKKQGKRVKRMNAELEKLQAQLDGAIAAGDEQAAKSLTRQVRKMGSRLSKQEGRAARAQADVDRYKRRLITALGRADETRPSGVQQRIPAAMAEDIETRLAENADPGITVPAEEVAPVVDEVGDKINEVLDRLAPDELEAVVTGRPVVPTPAERDAGLPGAPVAPIPDAGRSTTVRLPEDLRGAKPKYRDKNVTFASDLDRALFIVRDEAKRSKRDEDYMRFLRKQLPDLDDAGIRRRGNVVATRIKNLYDEADGTVNVDRLYSPGEGATGTPAQRQAAQATLADDGSLVDEAIDPTGRPQVEAPGAQTAQQVAFDAEGMTPPPTRMVGADMQELSFGDEVMASPVLPDVYPSFDGEQQAITEIVGGYRMVLTRDADGNYQAYAYTKGKKLTPGGYGLSKRWDADGDLRGTGSQIEDAAKSKSATSLLENWLDQKISELGLALDRPWAGKTPARDAYLARAKAEADALPLREKVAKDIRDQLTIERERRLSVLSEERPDLIHYNVSGGLQGDPIRESEKAAQAAADKPVNVLVDSTGLIYNVGLDTEHPLFDEFAQAYAAEYRTDLLVDYQPAIDPVAETLQGLPSFDEYLEAHPRFDEFSTLMAGLGERFDDAIARELADLEDDLSAEWATLILKDPDVRAAYLDSQTMPVITDAEPVPQSWAQKFGDEYDAQASDAQAMAGMGQTGAFGQANVVREDLGLGMNFHNHGGITRRELVDLIEEHGEEEVWAWWNTGSLEAHWNEDFLRTYGPSPKLRPDPGKGLPAVRKAARVPGEYVQAEFNIGRSKTKFLRVPWKGTRDGRTDYIRTRYFDEQEQAVEEAMQGADRPGIQRYVDSVLAERTTARQEQTMLDEVDEERAARIAERDARMAKYDEESRAEALEPWWQEVAAQQGFITETPADAPVQAFAPLPPKGGTKEERKAAEELLSREMSLSYFLPIDSKTPIMQASEDANAEAVAKYHAGEMGWSEQQEWARKRARELYLEYRELAPIPQPREYWDEIGVMDYQARFSRGNQKGGEYVVVKPSDRRLGEPATPTEAAPELDVPVDVPTGVPASEDVIQGTVLNRVDEPIPAEPAAAAPPAGGPPEQPPVGPGMEGAGVPEPKPRLPKTGELAQWLAKHQGGRDLPTQVIDGETYLTPSRDEFGREHAVHMYQTSDYVVIPHMDEIEAFGKVRNYAPWLHQGLQSSTDIWSLATLYGFRFAMRSSVEDLMTFTLTGGLGHLADLQRGRRGSTALRESNPDIVVEPEKIGGKLTGEERIVTPRTDQWWALGRKRARTSRLGMVARTSRHVSDMLHRGNLESTQAFWLGNLPQESVVKAAAEMQAGRYGAMQSLIAEAVGRMHFTNMRPEDIRSLQLLGGTHAGRQLLEKMAEAGAQINSGTYKALDDAIQAAADNPDLTAVGFKRPVQFGDFKRLALAANKQSDPFADWYWHRSLQAIVRDDGPIGHIFVKLMHNPEAAKKAIADAIRKDTRIGYRERFSLITSDVAVDDFAHRYYEASLPYFQKADGTINETLRSSFIDQWVDPKSGKTRMRVNWYQTDKRGREFMRVHPKALTRLPREDKPMYVLGREEKVVTAKNEKALLDRPWEWMGNQYARVAREPIFIGNYMANMRALSPMRDNLAQAMANGRTGKVGAKVTDADVKAAEAIVARQSQDAAYAFSLNYMDNPGNRSVLAWKVRNVARYYRATEDFARRATRLAKNYPDAYYKLAMTYQVLEDTGFTYRDDNGDMYFAYPANSFLQDAFSALGQFTNGFGSPIAADPFMVGGFVKNVAPSTDPEQWAPTMTGVVTLPMVWVFNTFPSLQGLRAATLGGYSNAGQTGSLAGEMVDAIMPAGLRKVWSQMEPGEREATLANAGAGAVASLIADGSFDAVYNTSTPLTLEQLKKNDVFAEAQKRAVGIVLTKMFMGYATPASPQVFQNNVTTFAREAGIESIDTLFQDLLAANNGDFAAAYIDWQRLDPDGKLLPFTVSKSKNNPDKLIGLTGAQPYKEVVDWMRADGTKALANKFPDAYMFLAPQEGTFDWASWAIIKSNGFRIDKTEDEMLIDLFAANGEMKDRQVAAAFNDEIAKYDSSTDEGREKVRELEAARAAEREAIKNQNPYWATKSQTRLEPFDVESIRQQFIQTQEMLTYMRGEGEGLTGTAAAIDAAMQFWMEVNIQKSNINSYTDAGKAEKARLDGELATVLADIGASDPGAQNFIDTILSSQSLFGRLT